MQRCHRGRHPAAKSVGLHRCGRAGTGRLQRCVGSAEVRTTSTSRSPGAQ